MKKTTTLFAALLTLLTLASCTQAGLPRVTGFDTVFHGSTLLGVKHGKVVWRRGASVAWCNDDGIQWCPSIRLIL